MISEMQFWQNLSYLRNRYPVEYGMRDISEYLYYPLRD